LGADQEIDGLPCLGGTLIWFHPNQRVSSLHLAWDCDVDGMPCASGKDLHFALNFHPNGRLAAAVLARSHVIAGRRYDRGTRVCFDRDGHVFHSEPRATVDRAAREVWRQTAGRRRVGDGNAWQAAAS
jgi:hypothetical protein